MLLALRRTPSFLIRLRRVLGCSLRKARRAVGAVDLPTCTLEDLDDMRAWGRSPRGSSVPVYRANGLKLCNRPSARPPGAPGRLSSARSTGVGRASASDFQIRTLRQNDCALDHVFQFAYVARPKVGVRDVPSLSFGTCEDPAADSCSHGDRRNNVREAGYLSAPLTGAAGPAMEKR